MPSTPASLRIRNTSATLASFRGKAGTTSKRKKEPIPLSANSGPGLKLDSNRFPFTSFLKNLSIEVSLFNIPLVKSEFPHPIKETSPALIFTKSLVYSLNPTVERFAEIAGLKIARVIKACWFFLTGIASGFPACLTRKPLLSK